MVWQIKSVKRLDKDENGVTVVEFALISPVFLFMLMGTFDIGFAIYMRSALNGAVQLAARDASLQDATIQANRDAIDAKVTDVLQSINRDAAVTITRKNYASYNDLKRAEQYTDTNGNGQCSSGEPFVDENGNGSWDSDVGATGLGGARDSVLYSITVSYTGLFPFGGFERNAKDASASFKLAPLSTNRTMTAQTILKNQPYGDQTVRVGVGGNC